VTQREEHGVASRAAGRRAVPPTRSATSRRARRQPLTSRTLAGAAMTVAALTLLAGCGGHRLGPNADAVAEPSGDGRREAPTVETPTADDVTPELLARVAAGAPATPAPVEPTTTAVPVTELPTTAPPEPPTTEPPTTEPPAAEPEPVEEAVPAEPPTTEPPPPTTEPPAPAAAWDTAAESSFVSLLNGQRAAVGLPALRVDPSLRSSARNQVQWMIDHATLAHQDLHDDLAQGWAIVGENVGYGPNAGVIHNALVASPGHYANIVHTQYSSVGIGVQVDANGRMWVSQVFGG
jgi:uncharacterized protein YkwD